MCKMNEILFFKLYIAALELALNQDDNNLGFYVKGPEEFIDNNYMNDVEIFINSNYEKHKSLFDLVDVYFDALSHYSTQIDGISIESYKSKLIEIIDDYKKSYSL